MKIYLIGSLRNEAIPEIGKTIRASGHDVFDDWYGAGKEADDYWKAYEGIRGRGYRDALRGKAATHVFNFDKSNLDWADAAVLVLPAGKSGHIELGYMAGQGKQTFILFPEEPAQDRWDLMYKFANDVFFEIADLTQELQIYEQEHYEALHEHTD